LLLLVTHWIFQRLATAAAAASVAHHFSSSNLSLIQAEFLVLHFLKCRLHFKYKVNKVMHVFSSETRSSTGQKEPLLPAAHY
jgi:hypothetical protein